MIEQPYFQVLARRLGLYLPLGQHDVIGAMESRGYDWTTTSRTGASGSRLHLARFCRSIDGTGFSDIPMKRGDSIFHAVCLAAIDCLDRYEPEGPADDIHVGQIWIEPGSELPWTVVGRGPTHVHLERTTAFAETWGQLRRAWRRSA